MVYVYITIYIYIWKVSHIQDWTGSLQSAQSDHLCCQCFIVVPLASLRANAIVFTGWWFQWGFAPMTFLFSVGVFTHQHFMTWRVARLAPGLDQRDSWGTAYVSLFRCAKWRTSSSRAWQPGAMVERCGSKPEKNHTKKHITGHVGRMNIQRILQPFLGERMVEHW